MATINSFYSSVCVLYVCEPTKGTRSAEMLYEMRSGNPVKDSNLCINKPRDNNPDIFGHVSNLVASNAELKIAIP